MSSEVGRTKEGYREGDVETWYPIVENETFKTLFIPLSPEQARALISGFYKEATKEQTEMIVSLEVS